MQLEPIQIEFRLGRKKSVFNGFSSRFFFFLNAAMQGNAIYRQDGQQNRVKFPKNVKSLEAKTNKS